MERRAACLEHCGSDYGLRQQVKAGRLYRVERGIYAEEPSVPELAVLAAKYPKAILTMGTAFYLHGLTDTLPCAYDLATDRDAAKISDRRVKQYFYPSDFFEAGAEMADYKGYPIRIFGLERMLIELIRYKTKLPFDFYKEIILRYRKRLPQLDLQLVQDLALAAPKRGKILETLQLEVL